MAGPRDSRGWIASPSPCSPAITASPRAASRPIRRPSPRRWWRISPPAARPSTRSPKPLPPNCAWCRSNSNGRRAISPKPRRWSADEFLEAVDVGYRTVPDDCDLLAVGEMGIANTTTAAHAVRGPARRRRGALGRPRHRRRRWRAGAQARGDRGRAEFPSRHSRRSAGGGGSTGRPRARGDRRRRARRAAASASRCCSTVSWRHRRCCRWRVSMPARSIIAAPGTSRPNPATAISCAN